MKPTIAVVAGLAAVAGISLLALPYAAAQPAAHAAPAAAPHAMAEQPMSCADMCTMRDQMMDHMKAADDRLGALATQMNHAGDQAATVGAMKDLLNEMVTQRQAMHEMAGMHEKMMAHAMGHMMKCMSDKDSAGAMESMQDCPMMKDMSGMTGQGGDEKQPESGSDATDAHGAHHPK